MPENESFNPNEEVPDEKSVEFDRSRYPDQAGCKTLPSLDGKTTSADIEDAWGDKSTVEGILVEAITVLNMPRLGPNIPDEVKDVFEQGIGLSLLSCRKEEGEEGDTDDPKEPIKIFIPTISGDVELLIRRSTLARKH